MSRSLTSSVLIAVLYVLTLSIIGCGEPEAVERAIDSPEVIRFTAIPDNDETLLRQRLAPLADYLTEAMGVRFEYQHVTNYTAAVQSLDRGDAFLGWFGGLTGVQARQRTGGRAIAQGMEDTAFYSWFIAHKSSGLTSTASKFPSGIRGRTLTFGSSQSTSGRLMPEFFIRKNMDGDLSDVFKSVGYSGSHSNTIRAVQSGAYQVGCVNGADWDRQVAAGTEGDAVGIWKTPTYFDYNWSVRGDMDEVYGRGFADRLTKALLAIDPSSNKKHASIMKAFTRSKFVAAANEDYSAIKETAEKLGLLRQE